MAEDPDGGAALTEAVETGSRDGAIEEGGVDAVALPGPAAVPEVLGGVTQQVVTDPTISLLLVGGGMRVCFVGVD